MKVIDLLNKIVNREEVPMKIKYEKHIYEYEKGTYDWSYYIENNGTIKFLLANMFNSDDNILHILNDEIEIIEETNKIEETKKIENISDEELEECDCDYDRICLILDRLDEIIDYINKGE